MRGRGLLGIVAGIAAAAAFGAGGIVIKPLLESGWSPAAAVLVRVWIAALALAAPALIALRGDLQPLWRARWTVLVYGAFAVAGVQVAYFAAIERIPVSTTLLIEYLAPVALVLLAWARTGRRPAVVVLGGALLAVGGLLLVVGPGNAALDPVGVALALLAMIGVAVYYTVGDRTDSELPPVALAAAGFIVGGVILGLVVATGLLPFELAFDDVAVLGVAMPWWAPLVIVGLVATAFAYVAGIGAITLLGTRTASFLGLSEVLFAALLGWAFLGEAMSPLQVAGGALILGGIVLVRLAPQRSETIEAVPLPDTGLGAAPATEPIPILPDDAAVLLDEGGQRPQHTQHPERPPTGSVDLAGEGR